MWLGDFRAWLAKRTAKRAAAVLVAAAALAVPTGWVAYQWFTLPDVARLATQNPETTAFIDRYRRQRERDPTLPPVRHECVPSSAISAHVKRAVVAAEDMEFFFHRGFSSAEIKAALEEALSGGALRGASTITQQLAKNLWLSPSRRPWRKVKEAILTRRLERHLSKERILDLYLNVVEFGPGIYGVESAARHYFGRAAADLTEQEGAMLAASLPRPSQWHPRTESRAYASYVATIRHRLDRAAFLWKYVGGPVPPELALDSLSDLDSLLAIIQAEPVDTFALPPLPRLPPPPESVAVDTTTAG